MLSAVVTMPEAERRRAARSGAPPPEMLQQLRSAAEGLQSQRQAIRDNLLRPSHNLPTRTLAQQVCHDSAVQDTGRLQRTLFSGPHVADTTHTEVAGFT